LSLPRIDPRFLGCEPVACTHTAVPCWITQFLQRNVLRPAGPVAGGIYEAKPRLSVCLSVCDPVSANKPLVRFSLNLVLESFTKVIEQYDGRPSIVSMNVCCTCGFGRIFGIGHLVPDIWYRIFGAGHLVLDIWCRTFGTGHLVPDIWYRTFGAGHLVPDIYTYCP